MLVSSSPKNNPPHIPSQPFPQPINEANKFRAKLDAEMQSKMANAESTIQDSHSHGDWGHRKTHRKSGWSKSIFLPRPLIRASNIR